MKDTYRIEHGWLMPCKRCVSTHFNKRPNQKPISLLVIHNISLPPGEFGGGYIESFFTGHLDASCHPFFEQIKDLKVSAHCLIDRHGEVTQFVPFDARAWHAGRSQFLGQPECNDYAIGIELEGTDTMPYTKAQYACLARLTKVLQSYYPLITSGRITGHSDIAPARKTDPGESFDWAYYRSLLST